MRIIIAGMGDVGFHLSKQLSSENHDIIAIDSDFSRLEYTDSLSDVLTINGSSTSISLLKKAKVETTDLVVAVTNSEEVNISTAILSKQLGAKQTIARISNPEYVSKESPVDFKKLGIDYLIYPEELAALETVRLIKRNAATDVIEFEGGKILLIGLKLDKSAKILNKTLNEIVSEYTTHDFRIIAIYRGMRTIIPTGKDRLVNGDQIFVITTPEGTEDIIKLSGKENIKIENIMILGGGKIGKMTAKFLENELNIKLIESNKEKSYELADYLQRTLVIQGDGRDIDLLAQEGIIDTDAFIAVTSDAETNIISCLMAKHLGVKKSIALVDKVDYIPLTQTIGLDSLINKKLLAANNITRFIRKGGIVSIATLQGIDAEVLEYEVKQKSLITKNKIKDLEFPKDAIIGGIIRGNESFIAVGNSQIQSGDKVVVFALPNVIKKIERLIN